ncbi:hypothetical protein EL22_05065 [Halostagnicola sp. A56]|uniref:hypothetical protein n=1 Tax=Halostagnicola sp. A56 TaxID=1495067 RepID=UPI00049F55E4|nr:hypothetical protein [Halostagnicola sp. A56]KDE58413.1 hypothetical protein EL22_05065 [Halostagnicola sp. A56]
MVMYDRSPSSGYRLIDTFESGFGWLAHPEETGLRASHALVGDDGDVWLFDPLDAPGIDEEIDALGDVSGIAVCSRYHARDAAAFARRYDVPVSVPSWLGRVPNQIQAPLEYYDDEVGSSGFLFRRVDSIPGWCEAAPYRETDGTLYVPDVLGTAPLYTTDSERLGVYLLCRLLPPLEAFTGLKPKRILVGHGTGLFDEPPAALQTALANARRGFPRALLENGPTQLRALTDALGE